MRVSSVIDSPEGLSDVLAGIMPLPQLQAEPGDRVRARLTGTAGVAILWTCGTGIITAGHVARTLNGIVTCGKDSGTTIYTHTPSSATQAGADMAVLTFDVGPTLGAYSKGTPQINHRVRMILTGGRQPTERVGIVAPQCFPQSFPGMYGDMLLTDDCVTIDGDSGAMVLDDATGQVIGHVIAGVPNVATFIQSVDYQLSELAATGRFAQARVPHVSP